jgi:hypothetical protein
MEATQPYRKLYLMLGISFVVMYIVMYLNVWELDHAYLNITRAYMALLMVTPMAILMVVMMPKMLPDKRKNAVIATSAAIVFVLSLVLLRFQTLIGDVQYMRAMIPHHSSAILTSQRATLNDPDVKELSRKIIEAQEREISEMKALIERLEQQ